jgi:hypothetical protein
MSAVHEESNPIRLPHELALECRDTHLALVYSFYESANRHRFHVVFLRLVRRVLLAEGYAD